MTALLGILTFLVLSTLGAERAMAQSTTTVPQITLVNTVSEQGHFLTVYYGIGSRASIATSGDQVTLREIKAKSTFAISGNQLVLPSQELTRSGVFVAYNMIVFVLHNGSDFTWTNADGSLPTNENAGASTQAISVSSLTKAEVDALPGAANMAVQVDLSALGH
jgi:hypothetical protein